MAPLDELYFVWLCNLGGVKQHRSPRQSHWRLMKQLFTTEFIWFIANDESRSEDGKELRRTFLAETHETAPSPHWLTQPCSVLELLLGLATRLEFHTDTAASVWFWHLLDTVGLHEFNDSVDDFGNDVNDIIERIMWRLYEENGDGGLFPLQHPPEDQRRVELWYQLNAYLIENY